MKRKLTVKLNSLTGFLFSHSKRSNSRTETTLSLTNEKLTKMWVFFYTFKNHSNND